jgi:hypothetical protein
MLVTAGSPGTALMYHAPVKSPLPITVPGTHYVYVLDPLTTIRDGMAPLGITPTFSWTFGPGQLPPGLTLIFQGLAIETTPSGQKEGFTNIVNIAFP